MSTKSRKRERKPIQKFAQKNDIWTLWQKYKIFLDKKLSALRKAASAQIRADAVCFSLLGDSDELIYEHLLGMMESYRRVVKLSGEYSFKNPEISALIAGICEVLGSRLREFESGNGVNSSKNPITREKAKILDEALSGISEKMENATNIESIYEIYCDGLNSCRQQMNDLSVRETARFYTELIGREWEELGNIIKVQVLALEEEVKLAEVTQAAVVASILDALREVYQQTGPVVENLHRLLSAAQRKPPVCRTFEEIEALIAKDPGSSLQQKNFFAALDSKVLTLLDDMDYKKASYSLQRMVSAEILLAEEITKIFENTLNLPVSLAAVSSIERDILSGIRETIEIKIASLKESIEDFSSQCGEILKNFSDENKKAVSLHSEGLSGKPEVMENVRNAWLKSPPEKQEINAFFENCRNGEAFAPLREGVAKQIETYTLLLEKAAFHFKKEVLLYEICTFEEILTHSVSRLRKSANVEVLAAAVHFGDAFHMLEIILKKNNISVIRPKAREFFDAKEHEVLVAEKQEGFRKGEIIKIVTAGYKFNEQIIIRANIIAAR